ncbi:hypothetical protein ADUPG1_007892 [Aduncisulcus paluster]|uniref:Uncharacterized protein n=1 Tax=Aduncisulcus paluster TaxID=2918883 RepID=A0ABQ5KU69_9EUKA|nr:hypothetical protein ADUPG1_007892 [Aduncisulcus paluster]
MSEDDEEIVPRHNFHGGILKLVRDLDSISIDRKQYYAADYGSAFFQYGSQIKLMIQPQLTSLVGIEARTLVIFPFPKFISIGTVSEILEDITFQTPERLVLLPGTAFYAVMLKYSSKEKAVAAHNKACRAQINGYRIHSIPVSDLS